MAVDGSGKRNLTRAPQHDNWSPAWSPDGSRIAFASTREGGTLSLWTMAPDGSDLRRVTDGHGEYPDWSPDGLLAWEGPGGWIVAPRDSSEVVALGHGGRLASWTG